MRLSKDHYLAKLSLCVTLYYKPYHIPNGSPNLNENMRLSVKINSSCMKQTVMNEVNLQNETNNTDHKEK